jgi:class 3 adenylate cyclase
VILGNPMEEMPPPTREIEELLTGGSEGRETNRVVATVLSTGVVRSTKLATEIGDSHWRALVERHDEVTRLELARFGGIEVKSTGDGFLAVFDGPAPAIRCADAIHVDVHGLGMEIRAGIHVGECEVLGNEVGGPAFDIAARLSASAAPGEIVVSRTVSDLADGSGIAFVERGTQSLDGVPGELSVLTVRMD